METPKTKIPFYQKRKFGEKMNASFDFIKENWKPMLKYSTYLILPVCLIQALSLNSFLGGYLQAVAGGVVNPDSISSLGAMFGASYAMTMLMIMIGSLVMTSLIYTFIMLYNQREEGLEGITFSDIKSVLFSNMGRLFVLGISGGIIVTIIITILVVIGVYVPLTFILIIPAIFACIIPLALWSPIYIYERAGVFQSLGKSFRLGFATWGGIFGILFVMGIIANILQTVTMLPWYVGSIVKYTFALSENGAGGDTSVFYNFMLYLLAIVQGFGTYLSMVFGIVGLSYQYSHANELVNNTSVESEIDNFEQLS